VLWMHTRHSLHSRLSILSAGILSPPFSRRSPLSLLRTAACGGGNSEWLTYDLSLAGGVKLRRLSTLSLILAAWRATRLNCACRKEVTHKA
jgi:hypothetical protein